MENPIVALVAHKSYLEINYFNNPIVTKLPINVMSLRSD